MRIFLLRLLLGWWIIPITAVIGVPFWYVMGGWKEAIATLKFFADQKRKNYK